jgi:hypothetical protein
MADDKAAESPLISTLRNMGRQLAVEVHAAVRNLLVSLAARAAMAVLFLAAAAVSVCIGIIFCAHGLHTAFQILIGSGWVADLMTGIIFAAAPLVAIAIVRRQAQPRTRPEPPPTHTTAK